MLELVNVSKEFGKLKAVNNISLSVEKGEIQGLIGPNGSGKTTLFNLITGFIKPTRGKILWQGRNIAGQKPHVIAREGVIRTFQLTNVYPAMTVMENLLIAWHLRAKMGFFERLLGVNKASEKERALEEKAVDIMKLMGMEREKDRIAGELPGGTQKILALTIALAGNPKLLMLDEPVAGLNTVEKEAVMDKIKILRDMAVTIFIVEHDMKTIMNSCDRVTVINFGEKIAEGSPEDVACDKRTIEAYLGKEGYGFAQPKQGFHTV